LTTRHLELEAAELQHAEVQLRVPSPTLSLKYGAALERVEVDVLADGKLVETIAIGPKTGGELTLGLATSITTLSFRSRSPYIQRISIDDLTYATGRCR
jgi:hypothetical protein